nr:unnamed protein product [Naegleria fowleri]
MLIAFKTVTKRQFELEANPTDTIKHLKQLVEDNTEFSSAGMKLIYGGKELNDDQTIESANIQSNIAVILVAKKKQHVTQPKKKEEETTSSTTTSSETKPPTTTTATESTLPSMTTPASTTATTTTATTPQAQEQIPGGPGTAEYDEAVQQFLEMGYDRNDIDECMKAAFYDRATAAEFLISGIPENVKQMMQEHGGNMPTPPQGGVAGLQGNQQGFSLRDLFTLSPQLNNLRNAIRQNPTLLREFLQHVSQVSPELYQIIQSNPREFLEIINETGPTQAGTTPPTGVPTGGETGGEQAGIPGGQQPPPGTVYITREDERKINELVGLGFTKNEAIQAYLACDRNQEMAANLLFENRDRGFEDDDEDDEQQGGQGGGMHD